MMKNSKALMIFETLGAAAFAVAAAFEFINGDIWLGVGSISMLVVCAVSGIEAFQESGKCMAAA